MPVRFDVRETPIVGLTIYITTCSPRIHRILVPSTYSGPKVQLPSEPQREECLVAQKASLGAMNGEARGTRIWKSL